MALIKNPAATKTPVTFENGDDTIIDNGHQIADDAADGDDDDVLELAKRQAAENDARAAAEAKAAAAAEAKAKSKSTEVATQKPNAHAIATPITQLNPYTSAKNAMTVKFNTFPQVQTKQGSFIAADGNKKLGDELVVQLVSFQDQWQVAPGDIENAESKKFLRYADNPTTAENGDNLAEVVALAKEAGFHKAKIQQRMILVVRVVESPKDASLVKKIVQFDLAPSSVAGFQRHQMNVTFAISEGELAEGTNPAFMRIRAVPKEQNKMSWTEIEFEQA